VGIQAPHEGTGNASGIERGFLPQSGPVSGEVERLARAAAEGDRAAVDELIARYLPDLRAFVRLRAGPLVRAREADSDIVQSVCREVLQHMDRFRFPGDSAFKQWLFATALRKISNRRDHHLAQKRDVSREIPIDAGRGSGDEQLLVCYGSFSTPSHGAMVREEMERVETAFEELTEEQREVITLAHVVGLSRAEIAEKMGRSEGAVRVLLHRSLARLSDLLGDGEK
jgi:RNA polymerase sigma-70 factor (ECF subfamily)